MKRWPGYILFGIGAVAVFLYLLFPAKSIKAYIAYHISQIDPRLRFTAKDPVLRLPPGVRLHDANIHFDKIPLIRWESLSFFPRANTLFADQRTYRYRGRAYQGEATGDLFLAKGEKWRIKGAGEGFQAELTPLAALMPQAMLEGTVTGTYDFTRDEQDTLSLTVASGSFILNEPLLEIEAVTFDLLTLDMVIEKEHIWIKTMQMNGPEINGDLTGEIIIRRPLHESLLHLTGMIRPHPLFLAELRKKLPPGFLSDRIAKKGLTFTIGGTVKTPEVSL